MGNDDPKYITRLMRMRCDKGTKQNYINVGTDHGILAGGNCDAQPVMNANDHTSQNVIHFGNCTSESNPERAFREFLVKALLGPTAGILTGPMLDMLEKMGILTYKCKPKTPQPWINANNDCILEGAPALTMNSRLACRYGGEISFVPLNEYDNIQPTAEDESGEETPEPKDVVGEAFNEAVGEAMGEIADLGEPGEKCVEKVQMALALAAAVPPQEGWDYDKARDVAEVVVEEGAETFFNAVRLVEPEREVTLDWAVKQMEPYGVLEHPTLGTLPLGVASALDMMGYQTQCCFGMDVETTSMAAADADAAVMMYATTTGFGCATFQADPPVFDTSIPTFTIYNGMGQARASHIALEEFDSLFAVEESKMLGSLTITVNKSKQDTESYRCANCLGGE